MAITLNHAVVPARDKRASARFLAGLLELPVAEAGHFMAVRVNDTLTLDYDNSDHFTSNHYAFRVSEEEFDAIFGRIKQAGVAYSADPMHRRVGEINHRMGGRGFYFYDPDGHNFEVLTHD